MSGTLSPPCVEQRQPEVPLRIALASDHAGFQLKQDLALHLADFGADVLDCGCHDDRPVDYVVPTLTAVSALVDASATRAIFVCGNGFAMAMLANRVPGMRAAVCHDLFTARTATTMGDANSIALGARVVAPELAWELVAVWMRTTFRDTRDGRYSRRLARVSEFETAIASPGWRETLRRHVRQEET